jgi:hypothetical protein
VKKDTRERKIRFSIKLRAQQTSSRSACNCFFLRGATPHHATEKGVFDADFIPAPHSTYTYKTKHTHRICLTNSISLGDGARKSQGLHDRFYSARFFQMGFACGKLMALGPTQPITSTHTHTLALSLWIDDPGRIKCQLFPANMYARRHTQGQEWSCRSNAQADTLRKMSFPGSDIAASTTAIDCCNFCKSAFAPRNYTKLLAFDFIAPANTLQGRRVLDQITF